MYSVEVDWAPAYELWISFLAFRSKTEHKTLDLGMDWVRAVQAQITPALRARIEKIEDKAGLSLPPLIKECPGDRSASGFLKWLGELSAGDLYEKLQPWMGESRDSPSRLFMLRDVANERHAVLDVLQEWNRQYFCTVDSTLFRGLAADAEAKRNLKGMAAEEIVEVATEGVYYSPHSELEKIFLVPQYHFRPWNIYDPLSPGLFILYPAEALDVPAGQPPTKLLRLTRALSDDNRLRILQYVAAGPRRFVDIVDFIGLSKGTVHHHMVTLRAAGLVRTMTEAKTGPELYVLRPGALGQVGEILEGFVQPPGTGRGPNRRRVGAGRKTGDRDGI